MAHLKYYIIIVVICVLFIKVWLSLSHNNDEALNRVNNNNYNKRTIDTGVSLLQQGTVVLRMGQGADSYLLSQLNTKDKTFSHCGIVFIENGYPFVYHSIGGEDNPDERLRRDSAQIFFSYLHNLAIALVKMDYNELQIDKLHDIVKEYYKKRPKFDMQFDLKTDDYLYCAEFVYKALNATMNDTTYIGTTHFLGHIYVGIDDIAHSRHAQIVWQAKFK